MAKSFNLSIVTPEKTIYESRICSLTVPSKLGYLGVLANHAPLIASLADGKITIKEESEKQKIFHCKGGLLEIMKNNVTILLPEA